MLFAFHVYFVALAILPAIVGLDAPANEVLLIALVIIPPVLLMFDVLF
jgi:hypothetical protein